MLGTKRVLVAGLLLLACLSTPLIRAEDDDVAVEDDDYADEERAVLLVRKYTKEQHAVENSNITVLLEVYNAGNIAAYDVKLKDNIDPSKTELIDGYLEASFDIPAGSTEKLQYVLLAKQSGFIELLPATIEYKAEADADTPQVATTALKYFQVRTIKDHYLQLALDAGKYVSLGYFRTVQHWITVAVAVAVIAFLFFLNWAYSAVAEARKRQKYRRALKEVENMQ